MNEEKRNEAESPVLNRRDFLKSTAVTATAATAALMASGNYAFAQGSDTIRVGLIGAGGRGTDASHNVLDAAEGVEIVAIADMFPYRIEDAKRNIPQFAKDKFKVKDDHFFTGFDAHKTLLALKEVNYVILATPPGFRPIHLRAAVEAGKNIFTEKPVGVDGKGIRSVFESADMAKAKGLSVVAGTQRRHEKRYLDVVGKIQGGAIGDVVGGHVYWDQGSLWMYEKRPEYSDLEWQLRNWYYFTWLCGDHIVEQHVHNLDVANWVMGAHPVKAVGLGGRQVRNHPNFGHIYDHFAVEYEYPNGVKIHSTCHQIDNTKSSVSEYFVGTKGTSDPGAWIKGPQAYRFDGDRTNPYVLEHRDNIAAIRAGKPLNEMRQVAESTLTAILGREVCYTGQELTWDQVLNANTELMPPVVRNYHGAPGDLKDAIPTPPVAVPGRTKVEREWNA
jgi:predicted dehydrogenase